MQLQAVIIPPPDVVRAALTTAHELVPPPPVAVEQPSRGFLGRILGRRQPEPPTASVVTLVPAPPEAVFVRLAKFGNVTADDAGALTAALAAAAGTWPAPVLRVSRVQAADARPFEVTAELEGDVDGLREIYRNVIEVARLQRFYLDRRTFLSRLTLGTIEVEGGATEGGLSGGVGDAGPVLDAVAGAEVAHRGQSWKVPRITLVRAAYAHGGTTFTEVARVELADGAEDSGALTGG